MADIFEDHSLGLTSPIVNGASIVPSDSTELPQITRAIYVAGSGNLSVELEAGSVVALSGIVGGVLHPLRVRRVLSTGTTATGLVALW